LYVRKRYGWVTICMDRVLDDCPISDILMEAIETHVAAVRTQKCT
jgi:hypothetical protein